MEDEIKAAQSSVRKRRSGDDTAGDDLSFAEATRRVQDEVGDLIFDVIMLACVCERDFGLSGSRGVNSGFTLAGAAANASAKVKRRCPYSFGSRSKLGPCPDRATEEAAWADVKAMEKASRAPGGGPMPPAPPLARRLGIGGSFEGADGCSRVRSTRLSCPSPSGSARSRRAASSARVRGDDEAAALVNLYEVVV